MLTREAARAAYDEMDMNYFPLTHKRITGLRNRINDKLRKADIMGGTMVAQHAGSINVDEGKTVSIRCSSYYFDDRELVTFSADGFIGFAGWADDTNVQPVLSGFIEWVKYEAEIAELN
jgi:hypothetical protein